MSEIQVACDKCEQLQRELDVAHEHTKSLETVCRASAKMQQGERERAETAEKLLKQGAGVSAIMVRSPQRVGERRLRRVVLCTGDVWRALGLLMHRWHRLSGLPPDAEIVHTHYEIVTDELQLLVWSSEFSIVPESKIVPVIDMVIETRPE